MGNFDKKREGIKPPRTFKPRKERDQKEEARGEKKEEQKPKGYKAKRSFTKNKDFRKNKTLAGGERKNFGSGTGDRVPFKRNFKRDKPAGGEGYKASRNDGDRGPKRESAFDKPRFGDRPRENRFEKPKGFREETKPFSRRPDREGGEPDKRVKYADFEEGKAFKPRRSEEGYESKRRNRKPGPAPVRKNDDGLIRLNKYLSNAGIASRREADNLIQSGTVKVNGIVITQLGYKINPGDKVTYSDQSVKSEKKVYLLLNKPKDYITTVDDPQERKTVMELIKGACRERLYPVGRLDRNTTGLLLFTNDGELTTKLTHPKFGVKKIYHVTLNKSLKPDDFKNIIEGVELEDGMVKADDLAFVGEGKKEIGIEIHSGRNRIVRRLFEHLGYDVIKLDRVSFAGLTKKDLPRGKHRFLTAKEISFLQMIG